MSRPGRLDSLPDEIKTLIARQCQLQDEEWRQRARAEVHIPAYSALTTWARFKRTTPQSSLRALFAVSRQWSRLVVPMVYEHLDAQATEALADPVFRCNILRRRGALVKIVSAIPSDDIVKWEDLVHCLPGLPNVEELHMTCGESQFLARPELDDQADFVRFKAKYDEVHLAVADLLRNVKTLDLSGLSACTIFAQLAEVCPPPAVFAVERLVVTADSVFSFGNWPCVARAMPRLESLDLDITFIDDEIDSPQFEFNNLKHLSIRGCHDKLNRCLFGLGQLHSSTLETLSLSAAETIGAVKDNLDALPPFVGNYPRLRKLTIDSWVKATRDGGRALLDSITPERFPRLEVLAVRTEQAFATETDLGPAFERLVTRPGFRLCEPVWRAPQIYSLLAYERGPVAVESRRRRVPNTSQAGLDRILVERAAQDETQFAPEGDMRGQLGDVVRFLSTSFSAATRRNDIAALGRLAQAVKGLVMEQMFMET